MNNQTARHSITLGLVSGAKYTVTDVFLCLEAPARQARELRLRAASGLKGVSTGIGFMGSPEWVIGGSLALGVLEGIASNATAKAAVHDLQEAMKLSAAAARAGIFVPIKHIDNIGQPSPSTWRGVVPAEFGEYNTFIHDGESFILVKTLETGHLHIAWEKVEFFVPPESSNSSEEEQMMEFGVSFNGTQFEYAGHRYDRLSDAISYARAQRAKV
jgi:hypothetical protein